MKLLKILHRWLGFPLGILFLVTFATGFLTAIDELISRWEHTGYQYTEINLQQQSNALSQLVDTREDVIRQIILPTPSTPYYQVSLANERLIYAMNDLDVLSQKKRQEGGFFSTALNLHRNFLLGRDGLFSIHGAEYVAWIGLVAIVISLLGFWIWWPLKKSFKVKDVFPQSMQRKHLFYSHMTAGVVTLLAIVLLGITGAAITYRSITKQVLGVEDSTSSPVRSIRSQQKVNDFNQSSAADWLLLIRQAQASIGEGQLTRIQWSRPRKTEKQTDEPSNKTATKIILKFETQDDWWGMDNSKVYFDLQSLSISEIIKFQDYNFSQKLYLFLVPLHTGRGLHPAYVIVLMLFSLLGSAMVFSGVVSFIRKKRQWKQVRAILAVNRPTKPYSC